MCCREFHNNHLLNNSNLSKKKSPKDLNDKSRIVSKMDLKLHFNEVHLPTRSTNEAHKNTASVNQLQIRFQVHWDLNKMATILQTTFSNYAFCWMKINLYWFIFHPRLSLKVQLSISQCWLIMAWHRIGTKPLPKLNTLRLRKNGHHSTDDIFRHIF